MEIGCILGEMPLGRTVADGLESRGHHVVRCDLAGLGPRDQALSLADFFGRARTLELVHNWAGSMPLFFARFVEVPLVTTVTRTDVAAMAPDADPAGPYTFSVALEGEPEVPDVPLLGRVAMENAVLSCERLYAEALKRLAREDHRPWGFYEVLSDDRADHKLKRITVRPGKRLSLQVHARRFEHWTVVSGEALVTVGEEQIRLATGESVNIPRQAAHRVENPGQEDLVFIEVQLGDYFGEDDIVRLEDDYGRS